MSSQQWKEDSLMWRGKVLGGPDAHWCNDWDGLPINAFDVEYSCCYEKKTVLGRIVNWFAMKHYAWSEYWRQRGQDE